jgi:hypothetical protein
MAYGLYLELDQSKWYRDDFSSDNALTGTIYTDKQLTQAKNLTGFTIKIRMDKGRSMGDRFGKTGTIVSATDGTFKYNMTDGDSPFPGIYRVRAELTKSGVKETTLNRVELLIVLGASA